MSEKNDEMPGSPAFAAFLEKRKAAATNPRPAVRTKSRAWRIDFGPTMVPAGETVIIPVNPRGLFRGEKLLATNDDAGALDDLHLRGMFVGKKAQFPLNDPMSFRRIAAGFVPKYGDGRDAKFDTCDPALTISMDIINRGSIPRMADLALFGILVTVDC